MTQPRAAGPTGIVFVSIPTDYKSGGQFWRAVTAATGPIEFALVPQTQPRNFSFIHASDPHIAPAVVDRYRRFRSMADSLRPAY